MIRKINKLLSMILTLAIVFSAIPTITVVSADTVVTDLDGLTTALSAAGEDTIVIGADIELVSALTVKGTKTLVSEGDYTLSRKSDSGLTGVMFTVGSGVTLNLGDNTYGGVITINSAYIESSTATATQQAILVNSGGTLNMYSGIITGSLTKGGICAVKVNGGTFNMYGGSISNNANTGSWQRGVGVYVTSNGTMLIDGENVRIENNTGVERGSAVYIGNGIVTMNNGYIANNTSTSGDCVFIDNASGHFIMNGGIIEGSANEKKAGTGLVAAVGGNITINGGTIRNTVRGAITNEGTGTIIIGKEDGTGPVFTNCYTTDKGAAVNNKVAGTVIIYGGDFSNCTAQYQGQVVCNNVAGSVSILGGYFHDNHTTNSASVYNGSNGAIKVGGKVRLGESNSISLLSSPYTVEVISDVETTGTASVIEKYGSNYSVGDTVLTGDSALVAANAGKFLAKCSDGLHVIGTDGTVTEETAEAVYEEQTYPGTATPDPNATATPEPTATAEPIATPEPTDAPEPTDTPVVTPTPTPVPTPTIDPNATPIPETTYVSLGLGQGFKLYPADFDGIVLGDLRNTAGIKLGSWGSVVDGSNAKFVGPYDIYNPSPDFNSYYGSTMIHMAEGGIINSSAVAACYNQFAVSTSGGTGSYVLYTPAKGLLEGVVTQVTVPYEYEYSDKNTKGLDAVITYDGGKTVTVNVCPDGKHDGAKPLIKRVNLGCYSNLESVKLVTRGTSSQFINAVEFLVVNEDPTDVRNILNWRKYVSPNIPTITPMGVELLPEVNIESPLKINEVVSSNKTGVLDSFGEASDWIEIYNSGDEDIDLSGYGLTDNPNKPFKWAFPGGTVIPAKGFVTVFASDNDTVTPEGEIHASYSISRGGEPIMLTTPEGYVADILDMPMLEEDQSIGSYPDGSNVIKYMEPTFNASNEGTAGVTSTYVGEPEFSNESGFYTESFNLTMTSDPGTVIYYTTDGSTPTTDSNEYVNPVNIYNRTSEANYWSAITYETCNRVPKVNVDKSMVIRAIAVDEGGNYSDVVTKTFFVGLDMAADYDNAMVLSVTADYDALYGEENGILTHVAVNDSDFQGREWERQVHLNMFESDGSQIIDQDCGIRIHGFGSNTAEQKAFNFYARSDYGTKYFEYPFFTDSFSKVDGKLVTQYKDFCVRTGSLERTRARFIDGAMQSITKEFDAGYQSHRPCVVFINGEYWGQYYLQERVSDDYVERHYGVPEENQILIKNHESKGEDEYAEADLELYRSERNWLAKTDFSVDANYQLLCEKYDIYNMLVYYAANLAMTNRDWGTFNFVTWRSREVYEGVPYQDGKWRFLFYDCDAAYLTANDECLIMVNNDKTSHAYFQAIKSNPTLKARLVNMMCDLISNQYGPFYAYNEFEYNLDQLMPLIQDLADRYEYTVNGLLGEAFKYYTYITARPYYAEEQMREVFGLTGDYAHLNVRVNNAEMGTVYVNDMKPDMTNGSYSGKYFNDYTQTVVAEAKPGYVFTGWQATEGTVLSSTTDAEITVTIPAEGARVVALFTASSEEGSEVNPYRISTAADLIAMAERVNSGDNSDYYVLANDITLTENDAFTAIGNVSYPFNGNFNGNYYSISGITINDTTQGQGLFGYVGENGVVKNVAVENITINGGKNVGGIVGNNAGLIQNCYTNGSLSGASTVGGIVGNNKGGTVENCYSVANIQSESANTLSGIAGKTENAGIVSNCYSLINPVQKNDGGVVENTRIVTADELADGTVTALLNNGGTTWIQGNGVPRFTATYVATYVRLELDGNNISVVTNMTSLNAKLIIAEYGTVGVNDVDIIPVTGAMSMSIPETMTGDVSVMLVSDTTNIQPLCPNVER